MINFVTSLFSPLLLASYTCVSHYKAFEIRSTKWPVKSPESMRQLLPHDIKNLTQIIPYLWSWIALPRFTLWFTRGGFALASALTALRVFSGHNVRGGKFDTDSSIHRSSNIKHRVLSYPLSSWLLRNMFIDDLSLWRSVPTDCSSVPHDFILRFTKLMAWWQTGSLHLSLYFVLHHHVVPLDKLSYFGWTHKYVWISNPG